MRQLEFGPYLWAEDGWLHNGRQLSLEQQVAISREFLAAHPANENFLSIQDLARTDRGLLESALSYSRGVLQLDPGNRAAAALQRSIGRKLARCTEPRS